MTKLEYSGNIPNKFVPTGQKKKLHKHGLVPGCWTRMVERCRLDISVRSDDTYRDIFYGQDIGFVVKLHWLIKQLPSIIWEEKSI